MSWHSVPGLKAFGYAEKLFSFCFAQPNKGSQRRKSEMSPERGGSGGGGRPTDLEKACPGKTLRDHPATFPGRRENKLELRDIYGLPTTQILCHGCSAAEQIGAERFEPLAKPQHSSQRLGVQVQYGVILLDVDQGFFVHVLQKLLSLLRHLQNRRWQSFLITHSAFYTCSAIA